MAKGIGNGFPLAAVVTSTKIAESLTQALHFNTYGGNPIACAVGLEVLKVNSGVIQSIILCEHSIEVVFEKLLCALE
jgi:acetylornithine/succinyldiaminopimelate/putrescine aminotransferase